MRSFLRSKKKADVIAAEAIAPISSDADDGDLAMAMVRPVVMTTLTAIAPMWLGTSHAEKMLISHRIGSANVAKKRMTTNVMMFLLSYVRRGEF